MNIQDKVAVITGGASGLGLATAKALKEKGAKLMLLDLNEDNAKAAVAELGDDADYCITNVIEEENVKAAMDKTVEKEKEPSKDPRKRFLDAAPIRVRNVLKHLRLVSNLLNRNYTYKSAEFQKIIQNIHVGILGFRICEKELEIQGVGGTPLVTSSPKFCAEPRSRCPKWWDGDPFGCNKV